MDVIREYTDKTHRRRWARDITPEVNEALSRYRGDTPAEKIYNYFNPGKGHCSVCGGVTAFRGQVRGYDTTCSRECREANKKITGTLSAGVEKSKKTNLERRGVDNPLKDPEVKARVAATNVERYGNACSMNRPGVQIDFSRRHDSVVESMLQKYGVTNPGQLPDHADKSRATLLANHGVDHWTKIPGRVVPSLKFADPSLRAEFHSGDRTRVSFTCPSCGVSSVVPYETFRWRSNNQASPCPDSACSGISTSRSLKESQVFDFVKSLCSDAVPNDRSVISPMELDVYVPSASVAVEFCGLYWHSGFSFSDYHRQKYLACSEVGVRLITVFEDEWDSRRSVCESLIASALGKTRELPVHARKCEVDLEVSEKESSLFCESHHVQGRSNSSLRFGLRSDGELVLLATFSGRNLAKGSRSPGYEVARVCSSKRVRGGVSRLLAAYKSEIGEPLVTYSDLRWGDGASYSAAGMEFTGHTRPNYWYVVGGSRVHRFAYRKSVLVEKFGGDPDKTETEIAAGLGLRRIYDCGHARYVWAPVV